MRTLNKLLFAKVSTLPSQRSPVNSAYVHEELHREQHCGCSGRNEVLVSVALRDMIVRCVMNLRATATSERLTAVRSTSFSLCCCPILAVPFGRIGTIGSFEVSGTLHGRSAHLRCGLKVKDYWSESARRFGPGEFLRVRFLT